MYVVDAHALIFYLLDKAPLNVVSILNSDEDIYVPTIVLAETFRLAEKRRINLDFSKVTEFVNGMKN